MIYDDDTNIRNADNLIIELQFKLKDMTLDRDRWESFANDMIREFISDHYWVVDVYKKKHRIH